MKSVPCDFYALALPLLSTAPNKGLRRAAEASARIAPGFTSLGLLWCRSSFDEPFHAAACVSAKSWHQPWTDSRPADSFDSVSSPPMADERLAHLRAGGISASAGTGEKARQLSGCHRPPAPTSGPRALSRATKADTASRPHSTSGGRRSHCDFVSRYRRALNAWTTRHSAPGNRALPASTAERRSSPPTYT